MRRAASASSEPDESNETIMQEELDKLRNDYRIKKNDKLKYEEEVKEKMNKMNEEKRMLEKENEDLNVDLSQAESGQNKRQDDRGLGQLKRLVTDYDRNTAQIDEEKQHISSLDSEIRKYDRLCKDKKKIKENSVSNKQTEVSEVKKTNERKTLALENRYEKQIRKYNETLTLNAGLRDEIEKLRNERSRYNEVYKRLDQELEHLRSEKADITESATLAYDQRDEANNKCIVLKEKNDKDRIQHEMDMRDQQRIIEHDCVLREFMNTKSDERFEWKKMSEERRRKHGSSGEIAQKHQRKQIMTYENAFNRIKDITKEEDINILVENFIRNEDDNFAMFQYVSELNNKIEILNEEIANINLDIERFEQEESKLETERHRILKELETSYNQKKEEADRAQTRLTEINKVLEQVREGVRSIFKKINCDESVILDILGGDSTVTDRNLMMYLGSVEQRTNTLLAVLYYVQTKQFNDSTRKELPEHGITLGLANVGKTKKDSTMNAPLVDDDILEDSDENSDDNLRPFSQKELYAKALKDMKKKDTHNGGYNKSSRQGFVDSKKRKN